MRGMTAKGSAGKIQASKESLNNSYEFSQNTTKGLVNTTPN
jgi:hypothetical protein